MDVYVDADGCPVVEDVVEIAGEEVPGADIHLVHNRHHDISWERENVHSIETGDRPDEADHYIYNNLEEGDLVITDDLGLAGLVLNRDVSVIRFRGDTVGQDDIEHRLTMRHYSAKARRDHGHGTGPPAFEDEDRARFRRVLRNHLTE